MRSALPRVVLALAVPAALSAQGGLTDRLELHGSLNAAYGKADTLGVFGVPQKGTSDYRVFTVQARYTLGQKDVVVAQVFNRRLGASPLASAVPDVSMQWAFWQHREGPFTAKLGRNPLPRGLYNEVRYIGTVQPFFRPPIEVQQEAFDAIDGAVLSYRAALPFGAELEQHGFFGGSENRAIANTTAGQQIRIARTENMFGYQSYLTLPVAGLRLGAYGARYAFVQPTQRGYRSNLIYSAEATVDRVKLATEHSRISGHGPSNDNRGGYYQATVRLVDRFSVAGQHAYINRKLYFANAAMNSVIPEVRTNGLSGILSLPAGSVLKVEHHWRRGWSFDAPTAPIASQTANSFTLSPKRDARYFLISVASSF
ncbi:hypothetical protein [Roseisolibacter sp. H3M3-2]|uniref:hypothetical protein n=1 Tax=Roseisolibacter sp. H3M3-2 TaxID=3031323 RepID=UPI0023DC705C|nr:hypothetical protein [Roseisolibacter sp. H3M3-2]MDF1503758.1 hypothetical protein [Roseisolibacter sp. H3M3-2]